MLRDRSLQTVLRQLQERSFHRSINRPQSIAFNQLVNSEFRGVRSLQSVHSDGQEQSI